MTLRIPSASAVIHTISIFLLSLVPALAFAQSVDQLAVQEPPKPDKSFFTPQQRLTAMHAAALFAPRVIAGTDVLKGPDQRKKEFKLHFNDKVICDFAVPGNQMGGNTPKFGCKITSVVSANGKVQTLTPDMDDSDPIKVKYGGGDNEVFAEIPSTRLFWVLGYYVDSWFPVSVECHNCPENPESGSGATATRTFEIATIVRKFPWHKMTEAGNDAEGWSWKELDTASGAPTYQRDGLKLLAAFVQHGDNKAPQQRVACHKVNEDATTKPTTTTCDKSVMLVQDLGATLGSAGFFTSNDGAKMNVDNWSGKKLWNSAGSDGAPHECRASLTKSLAAHDGLSDPAISEEGRRFDAGLMCQLSDDQIADLFKASRAIEMPKYHNKDGSLKTGVNEDSVIKQWVAAFKAKREDLAKARCEWKEKPVDLAVIDNPAKLPTVPNFCSAKPF